MRERKGDERFWLQVCAWTGAGVPRQSAMPWLVELNCMRSQSIDRSTNLISALGMFVLCEALLRARKDNYSRNYSFVMFSTLYP